MLSKSILDQLAITADSGISDIHWKTQSSTVSSILFYKINPGQEKLFFERISCTKFGWLVVNQNVDGLPVNSSVIPEAQWPSVQKTILDELYPLPNELKLIAVTGTNGKTTTTDLVLQLGELVGKKGLSIGTLGVREYHRTILNFELTSPPYIDLRKYLFVYGQDKDFCVLEASSHALTQCRLYKLRFDAGGWLSFSQDHLDYHKNMDEYFKAKAALFSYLKADAPMFIPLEQTELYSRLKSISRIVTTAPVIKVTLPLFFSTRFNRNNLEVAEALIRTVFNFEGSIDYALLVPPHGRFFIKSYRSNFIVVDFAHTPDALKNICQSIRSAFPHHRLKVLFGCGGDRDRAKRSIMARVVDQLADEIYVTSDNPRSENPKTIIHDILLGISQTPYQVIVERPAAVQLALNQLTQNEVLLLAGKGHEDYILINGIKHPYSDIQQVNEFLARKGL